MPTRDSKKLLAKKFDEKINSRGVKSPTKIAPTVTAAEDEGARLSPWMIYFLVFVLFGSVIFGALQTISSGPVW